jgi:hypothetical protein
LPVKEILPAAESIFTSGVTFVASINMSTIVLLVKKID